MKKMTLIYLCMAIIFLHGCANNRQGPQESVLEISEDTPNKKTGLVKQNLIHLAQVYDLTPLLFTKKINISKTPPPITNIALTIDTSFAEQPNFLLSQFIHAELHVWMLYNREKSARAIADLKKIYPKIPTEFRGGDRINGYGHLIICYLEFETLSFYVGKKQAQSVITDLMKKKKIFPWTYYQVLNKNFAIKQVVEKHLLLPPLLR